MPCLDPDLERAFSLMEEDLSLTAQLCSDFAAVEAAWVGDDVFEITRRNKDLLVSPFRLTIAEYAHPGVASAIDSVIFHFLNYANSYFALRQFMYKGYTEIPQELKNELHLRVTAWKQTPHHRIIMAMRNRFEHGGKLIRGIRTYRQTIFHPQGSKWAVSLELYESARVKTRAELPVDSRRLFDAICGHLPGGQTFDFAVFIDETQRGLEDMYSEVYGLIKTHFAEPIAQYETLRSRLRVIAAELRAFEPYEEPYEGSARKRR
jgi:hypothetical protein